MPNRTYTVDLRYNIGNSNAVIQAFGQGLENIANINARVATSFGLVGGAAAAAFTVSGINTIREYGRGLAEVQGILGATNEEFRAVEQSTRDLSAATEFTARSILSSYRDVARSGANTAEALNLVPAALRLSVATATEVENVTRNLTSTMRAFGVEFSDVARISDVLTTAVNTSNTTFEELTSRLDRAGSIAQALMIPFEDTIAVFQRLANVGVVGERASTAYSIGLRRLAEAGLDFSRPGGLITVLRELEEQNLSLVEAIELLGEEAGPAFLQVINGADAVEAFADANRNARGATEELAAAIEDNLEGSFRLLVSSFEALEVNFFDRFEGEIRSVVDGVNSLVLALADAPEIIDQAGVALATFVGGTAGIALLARFGSILTTSIVTPLTQLVSLNFTGLLGSLSSITGTFIGIAGVSSAFIAGLSAFRETFIDSDSEGLRRLGLLLDELVMTVSELIGITLPDLSVFTSDLNQTLDNLGNFATEAILQFVGVIDNTASFLSLARDRIELFIRQSGLELVIDSLIVGLAFGADVIVNGFQLAASAVDAIVESVNNFSISGLTEAFGNLISTIYDWITRLPTIIGNAIVGGADASELLGIAGRVISRTDDGGGNIPTVTSGPRNRGGLTTTASDDRNFLFRASDATEEAIGRGIQFLNRVSGAEAASLFLTQRFPRTTGAISQAVSGGIPGITPFLERSAANIPFGFLLPTGTPADILGGGIGVGAAGRLPVGAATRTITPSGQDIPGSPTRIRTDEEAFAAIDPARFTPFRSFDQSPTILDFISENFGVAAGRIPEGIRGVRRFLGNQLTDVFPERAFAGGPINRIINRVIGETNLRFSDPTNPRIRGAGNNLRVGQIGGLNQEDLNFILFGDQPRGDIPESINALSDPDILARLRETTRIVDPDNVGLVNSLITGRVRSVLSGDSSISDTFTPAFTQQFLDAVTQDSGISRSRQRFLRDVLELDSVDPRSRNTIRRTLRELDRQGRIEGGIIEPLSELQLNELSSFGQDIYGTLGSSSDDFLRSITSGNLNLRDIGFRAGTQIVGNVLEGSGNRNIIRAAIQARLRPETVAGRRNLFTNLPGDFLESDYFRTSQARFAEAFEGINFGFPEAAATLRGVTSGADSSGLGILRGGIGEAQNILRGPQGPEDLIRLPPNLINNVDFLTNVEALLRGGVDPSELNTILRNLGDVNARARNRRNRLTGGLALTDEFLESQLGEIPITGDPISFTPGSRRTVNRVRNRIAGGVAAVGAAFGFGGTGSAQELDSEILANSVATGELPARAAYEADPSAFARTFPITARAFEFTSRGSLLTGRTSEEIRASIEATRSRRDSGGLEQELRDNLAFREQVNDIRLESTRFSRDDIVRLSEITSEIGAELLETQITRLAQASALDQVNLSSVLDDQFSLTGFQGPGFTAGSRTRGGLRTGRIRAQGQQVQNLLGGDEQAYTRDFGGFRLAEAQENAATAYDLLAEDLFTFRTRAFDPENFNAAQQSAITAFDLLAEDLYTFNTSAFSLGGFGLRGDTQQETAFELLGQDVFLQTSAFSVDPTPRGSGRTRPRVNPLQAARESIRGNLDAELRQQAFGRRTRGLRGQQLAEQERLFEISERLIGAGVSPGRAFGQAEDLFGDQVTEIETFNAELEAAEARSERIRAVFDSVGNTIAGRVTTALQNFGQEGVTVFNTLREIAGDFGNQLIERGIGGIVDSIFGEDGLGGFFSGDNAGERFAGGLGSFFRGSASNLLPSIFGFQQGGSIVLGQNPGVDRVPLIAGNQLIGRVSNGERIDITPRGQSSGTTQIFNFNLTSGSPNDRRNIRALSRSASADFMSVQRSLMSNEAFSG